MADYFGHDPLAHTITIFNADEDLPNPLFYVVLCNIIDDRILW